MADINDRLERLNRREEFARRGYHGLLPSTPDMDLDDDFVEVLIAVSRVVQRHPGLSVMLAPADGRPGRTVIRVSENAGQVETAVVAVPPPPPRASAALGEPAGAAPEPGAERAAGWVPANGGRHADDRRRDVGTVPLYPVPSHPAATHRPAAQPAPLHAAPSYPAPSYPAPSYPPAAATPSYPRPYPAGAAAAEPPMAPMAPVAPAAGEPAEPAAAQPATGQHASPDAAGPGLPAPGLVTLTDETSQVVARLAQMLRDDPSLASGWVRQRSP